MVLGQKHGTNYLPYTFCERGRAGKCLCPDTASVSVTLSFREFAKSMAEKFKLAFWAQTVNFSAITQISES